MQALAICSKMTSSIAHEHLRVVHFEVAKTPVEETEISWHLAGSSVRRAWAPSAASQLSSVGDCSDRTDVRPRSTAKAPRKRVASCYRELDARQAGPTHSQDSAGSCDTGKGEGATPPVTGKSRDSPESIATQNRRFIQRSGTVLITSLKPCARRTAPM